MTSTSALPATLTEEEIRLMRVRDIKRSLSKKHGYTLDEVARMLDKQELIRSLVYEERKEREKAQSKIQRERIIQALMTAFLGAVVLFCWPLLVSGYEVLHVNVVVWTDRKVFEMSRCRDLKSSKALIGVMLMLILDGLQFWLSVSMALSWIIRRTKYFFPTPQLTIQPGQMLGKEVAGSAIGSMGINIAPMLISWLIRFVHGRLETWTGRAMSQAMKLQRKAARDNETTEERAARKAVRQRSRGPQPAAPPTGSSMSSEWMEPQTNLHGISSSGQLQEQQNEKVVRKSFAHEDFIKQLDEADSMFDLD